MLFNEPEPLFQVVIFLLVIFIFLLKVDHDTCLPGKGYPLCTRPYDIEAGIIQELNASRKIGTIIPSLYGESQGTAHVPEKDHGQEIVRRQ